MKNRTAEEDWFLRGGEKPLAREGLPPPPEEIPVPDGGDDGGLDTYSVRLTGEVRVKVERFIHIEARSWAEALDIATDTCGEYSDASDDWEEVMEAYLKNGFDGDVENIEVDSESCDD